MSGRYIRKSDKQRIAEVFQVGGDLSSLSMPDADLDSLYSESTQDDRRACCEPQRFHLVVVPVPSQQ